MPKVINALRKVNLDRKVSVGGTVIAQNYADGISADGCRRQSENN